YLERADERSPRRRPRLGGQRPRDAGAQAVVSVTSGQRLGAYVIIAKLGKGEVWRATDSRLRREVAIKVLPAAFTADAERLARFEREAQLLAQLNHPNIAHVYGLETNGDTHALVMELVDGEDLAQRIARGPLALDEALAVAK